MVILAKTHTADGKVMLALCDKNLIGKSYEQGKAVLDLKSDFYNGEEMDVETIMKHVYASYIINAVGQETINLLLHKNLIDNSDIKTIQDIPYTLVIVTEEA